MPQLAVDLTSVDADGREEELGLMCVCVVCVAGEEREAFAPATKTRR